jgi:ATP-dependent DNA helicase RecG
MTPEEQRALVETIIAGGESLYAEFKSAWRYGPEGKKKREIRDVAADIARTVVAFANADGGDLLVGVEDDGAITGVPWEGDRRQYLVSVPDQQIEGEKVGVLSRTVQLPGGTVLWFRVLEASEAVVTSDGRCLLRRGAQSVPVAPRAIQRRREHRYGDGSYEAEPVPQARLEDLELDPEALLRRHSRAFAVGSVLEKWTRLEELPPEQLLRYWNLAEPRNGSFVLRRAALLLFAKDALRWHPNNRVRIRRVHEESEGFGSRLETREHEVIGPIHSLLPRAIGALDTQLETERRGDQLFAVSHRLPREAIDETIINAVAHRNYAIEGQAIEILQYPDRLEVRSPGRLPEPISVEDLKQQRGVHRSRNPLLMRVLRDLGWSRDQGEGMRRIFGSMRQMELHLPELEEVGDTFVVRLSTRSVYDDDTQAWLASYGPFGLRAEDRRYMIVLKEHGGRLSTDRLARQLGESFDASKQHLQRLERLGLVRRKPRGRTYFIVEASNVPHELAARRFGRAGLSLEGDEDLKRSELETLVTAGDDRPFETLIAQWQRAGILRPVGKGRWRLGVPFLQYLSART